MMVIEIGRWVIMFHKPSRDELYVVGSNLCVTFATLGFLTIIHADKDDVYFEFE